MVSADPAAVSAIVSASIPATAAAPERTHWLQGIYFIPSPDISDETRWAINQGRAMPLWEGLMALLHNLERKGATESIRDAAAAGRLDHLGVNGIAKAIHMSPTAVLRQLRHLERVVGIVATDQKDFTLEADPVTGKIVRNYARAEPKAITITVKEHHLRPAKAVQAKRQVTHEPNARQSRGTHEPNAKGRNLRVRNRCVPIEPNLQRGSVPMEPNRRRNAAVPQERPAASAAKASTRRDPYSESRQQQAAPPTPPPDPQQAWRQQGEEERRRKERNARIELYSAGLGMSHMEVRALWMAAPQELERLVKAAGLDCRTPGERSRKLRELRFREPIVPTLNLNPDQEAARSEAMANLQREADEKATREAEEMAAFRQQLRRVDQSGAAFSIRKATTEAISLHDEPGEPLTDDQQQASIEQAKRDFVAQIAAEGSAA